VPTSLPLHLAGISHHTADVGVREQLVLPAEAIAAWLDGEQKAGRSLVVVTTCNRLELYWWGDHDQEGGIRAIARERGMPLDPRAVYRRDGLPALTHLFLVAAGLDSQVVGEHEILGQLRRAYEEARSRGTTTWELEAAFSAALSAGRRVRRESGLGRHPDSVASAAVAHAKRCAGGSLADRSILVLGAGEVAEGVVRALEVEACGAVLVLGRTAERAEALANSAAAACSGWDTLPEALAQADVIFAATAAPRPVVSDSGLAQAIRVRSGCPIVVLDLAVPRNVEPAARDVPGVRLFDLDDLRLQHCPAAVGSSPALERAEALIRDEVAQFRKALRSRAAAPHLAELHRLGEHLAGEEAGRALAELGPLSEEQQEIVRHMAERLVRRLLYPASRKIRENF
jgi:glutamyl-tRNA reductase